MKKIVRISLSFLALCTLIIYMGCTNTTSTEPSTKPSPVEKIDAILEQVNQNIKTLGIPEVYGTTTNQDSLEIKIADEGAKAIFNSDMLYFKTVDCIRKYRHLNLSDGKDSILVEEQTKRELVELSVIRNRCGQLKSQFREKESSKSMLDYIIAAEKLKIMIKAMEDLCMDGDMDDEGMIK